MCNMCITNTNLFQLTGTIPSEIGGLTRLGALSLSGNRGITGTLPKEIEMLRELRFLCVENSQLGGSIPAGVYSLTRLEELQLDNCLFSGTLSTNIGKLKNLHHFSIPNNNFYGTIPTEISAFDGAMVRFAVNGNNFTGIVPEPFCTKQFSEVYIMAHKMEVSRVADCTPSVETGLPAVGCSCCTECCDPNTGICQPV